MSIDTSARAKNDLIDSAHLGESAVVPDIAVVREAVTNEAQTTLLNILLDGIEGLLLGYLHLGVGPPRNLDNHVEDPIVLVREEGDVMEWGDDLAVAFDENTVICTFINKILKLKLQQR